MWFAGRGAWVYMRKALARDVDFGVVVGGVIFAYGAILGNIE
jgi:hypothetical protein